MWFFLALLKPRCISGISVAMFFFFLQQLCNRLLYLRMRNYFNRLAFSTMLVICKCEYIYLTDLILCNISAMVFFILDIHNALLHWLNEKATQRWNVFRSCIPLWNVNDATLREVLIVRSRDALQTSLFNRLTTNWNLLRQYESKTSRQE